MINSEGDTIDELAFQSNDIDVKSDPNKVLNSSFDRTHCGSNLNAEHQRHLSECLLSNPENDRGDCSQSLKSNRIDPKNPSKSVMKTCDIIENIPANENVVKNVVNEEIIATENIKKSVLKNQKIPNIFSKVKSNKKAKSDQIDQESENIGKGGENSAYSDENRPHLDISTPRLEKISNKGKVQLTLFESYKLAHNKLGTNFDDSTSQILPSNSGHSYQSDEKLTDNMQVLSSKSPNEDLDDVPVSKYIYNLNLSKQIDNDSDVDKSDTKIVKISEIDENSLTDPSINQTSSSKLSNRPSILCSDPSKLRQIPPRSFSELFKKSSQDSIVRFTNLKNAVTGQKESCKKRKKYVKKVLRSRGGLSVGANDNQITKYFPVLEEPCIRSYGKRKQNDSPTEKSKKQRVGSTD